MLLCSPSSAVNLKLRLRRSWLHSVIDGCFPSAGGATTSEPYRMPTAPVLTGEQGNAKLPPLVKAANTAARHAQPKSQQPAMILPVQSLLA